MLHAAEWHREQETEESVSMRLMKGTADNPADEHLVSERGAIGRCLLSCGAKLPLIRI